MVTSDNKGTSGDNPDNNRTHHRDSDSSAFIKIRKSHLFYGFVIILVLVYFGNNSYQTLHKQNSRVPVNVSDRTPAIKSLPQTVISDSLNQSLTETVKPESIPPAIDEKNKNEEINNQKVITYKSSFYDRERNGKILNTYQEVTFHTFNFTNNTVTQRSRNNGEWIEITYPFSGSYEEKGMLSTTYVLKVGTLGVKEIWWSPEVPNLGYDYDDGTRLVINCS